MPLSQSARRDFGTLPRSNEPINPRNAIAGACTASCAGWAPAAGRACCASAVARAVSGWPS